MTGTVAHDVLRAWDRAEFYVVGVNASSSAATASPGLLRGPKEGVNMLVFRRSVSVLFLAGLACAAPTRPDGRPTLGEEFVLAVGESAEVAGTNLVITFREVLDDSRCPSDALILCVWEGDASVTVRAQAALNEPGDLELHTNNQFEISRRYVGFEIRLVELDPYPATTDPTPEENYRLKLAVTRAD